MNGRPDYCDPRAEKFFSWVYTGTTTESGHHWSWDSTHKDLKVTTTHRMGYTRICGHCGNRVFPIQRLSFQNDVGFTCICSGAMNELEWKAKQSELAAKHEAEREELNKLKPQLSKEVYSMLLDHKLASIKKAFTKDGYLSDSDWEALDITINEIE